MVSDVPHGGRAERGEVGEQEVALLAPEDNGCEEIGKSRERGQIGGS